jgi:hypothetical protein
MQTQLLLMTLWLPCIPVPEIFSRKSMMNLKVSETNEQILVKPLLASVLLVRLEEASTVSSVKKLAASNLSLFLSWLQTEGRLPSVTLLHTQT